MDDWAYPFDYAAFKNELAPLLEAALSTDETDGLACFIDANLSTLKNPYALKPLDLSWRAQVPRGRVRVYGYVALTKYFDLDGNLGDAIEWPQVDRLLEQLGMPDILYGEMVGKGLTKFDPTQEGTYFQSPVQVMTNLHLLENLVREQSQLTEKLSALIALFRRVAETGKGLYTCFYELDIPQTALRSYRD
jgi:hypothetical protein